MFVDLTPEQQRIIALAKELAKEFAQRAEQHDREGSFPFENIARLKETGYTTITTPTEYGGWGATPFTFVLAQEQLAQGCCATAFAINMHCNTVGFYTPFMTPAQKDLYLGNVGRKQMLMNAFYTEGGGARSIQSPNSKARKVPGGYILNGRKVFATLVPAVDYLGFSTTLEGYSGPNSGGCAFLLPRDTPGLEVIENWDAMGMRATGSHTIEIRDVFARDDQRIGEEGHLFEEFAQVAHWYCLSFSAVYLGIGQAAYEYVLDYCRTRKVQKTAGQLVGHIPWNRFAIGEMYNRLEACRIMIYTVAREISEKRPYGERQIPTVEMLRTFVAENMLEVANLAARVGGGLGYLKGNPLERYFRDLRSSPLHTLKRDEVLEMLAALELGFA
ncbi:MAG TPA: acyl-CoA dehydrogenase family protein [Candidatus Binataceae bacterium]|nr:acyl-CoA dehydrogenase family protein [Candidatus Binataceae bacterium]